MEINGATNFRHWRSPSSDRFLGFFSPSTPPAGDRKSIIAGHELNEAEIFWTDGGSDDSRSSSPISRRKLGFRGTERSGILAALTNDEQNRVVLPSATPFRSIPKPPPATHYGEFTQSAPSRKFQNSAPMKVPALMKNPRKFNYADAVEEDQDDDDDDEMLPPHEIVAMKLKATSSVLEGVGRTLKGRDLRQVRNAVWRKTGFVG